MQVYRYNVKMEQVNHTLLNLSVRLMVQNSLTLPVSYELNEI